MKSTLKIYFLILVLFCTANADNIYNSPVKIKSNLTVTGNTSVQGISATATSLTGTVTSSATVNSSGTLNQSGAFIASGANTLSGLTTVANTLTSNSTINSNGAFVAAGANTLTGPTTVGNTLTLNSGAPIISSSTSSIGSGSVAVASALLDLTSTTKGLLPPRMTTTQRDAISSPAIGLTIYNTTTTALNAYNGAAWVGVGSGTGSGRTNNITGDSTDLENTIGNWVTFDDGGSLVDGTSGSPSVITITRNTTTPLQGNGDFKISHTAADATGEGTSLPFTSREADKSRVQEITFEYKTGSTYVDDVYDLYVYDVTNSVLIPLTPSKLKASVTPTVFKGIYQNPYNSTSLRLIVSSASSAATSSDIYLDNIISGPPIYNYGLVGTDWKTFTPTGSFTTNTTYSGHWRRVGNMAEYEVELNFSGAPNSTNLRIDLIHTIDTIAPNGILSTTSNKNRVFGQTYVNDNFWGSVGYNTATSVYGYAQISSGDSRSDNVTQSQPVTLGSGNKIVMRFAIPVLGWSSNVQLSDDSDIRIVAAEINSSGTTAIPSSTNTKITSLSVVTKDTHGAWNTSTNEYVIPVTGWYDVSAVITGANQARTVPDRTSVLLYKNGAQHFNMDTRYMHASLTVRMVPAGNYKGYFVAGDALSLYYFNGATDTVDAATFMIQKVQGPNTIGATETISCRYGDASGTTPTNGSNSVVKFTNKMWDTHGTYNTSTGIFTAPIAGEYEFNFRLYFNNFAAVADDRYMYIFLEKNNAGEYLAMIKYTETTSSIAHETSSSGSMKLLQGETVRVVVLHNLGSTPSISSGSEVGYFSARKVGNY